jgi:hypothetical protein
VFFQANLRVQLNFYSSTFTVPKFSLIFVAVTVKVCCYPGLVGKTQYNFIPEYCVSLLVVLDCESNNLGLITNGGGLTFIVIDHDTVYSTYNEIGFNKVRLIMYILISTLSQHISFFFPFIS